MNTATDIKNTLEDATPSGIFAVQRSWLDEAAVEAIDSLPREHKEAVMNRYMNEPNFRPITHAVIMYIALHTSMAECMTEGQDAFQKLISTATPDFVGDFDAVILANSILDNLKNDASADLNVPLEIYRTRIGMLQENLTH